MDQNIQNRYFDHCTFTCISVMLLHMHILFRLQLGAHNYVLAHVQHAIHTVLT